jgi:CheY-like chemotaxis protein
MIDNIMSEDFLQQVHECLSNYYEYSFLRNHPLVKALTPQSAGEALHIQDFRRTIDELLARLRPGDDSPLSSKYARHYKILFMRYIDQLSIQQILYHLDISERQYYRDHAKAMETFCHIIWDRMHGIEESDVGPLQGNSISIQSEIWRVHNQEDSAQLENLTALLESTVVAMHGLAEQHGATIRLLPFEDDLGLYIDPTVLRQAIIWIISQLLMASANPVQIDLYCKARDTKLSITFSTSGETTLALEKQEVLQYLTEALGATLSSQKSQVVLEVPAGQDNILIIDDNPDAIELLKSYLVDQPYHVLTALDGTLGIQLARKVQPAVIVLDIMLPKQDGWEILQNIKHYPSTQYIPVLICSVLDTPDLAISLGADGFLKKPPSKNEFQNAVESWRRRASSTA